MKMDLMTIKLYCVHFRMSIVGSTLKYMQRVLYNIVHGQCIMMIISGFIISL